MVAGEGGKCTGRGWKGRGGVVVVECDNDSDREREDRGEDSLMRQDTA